MVYKKEDIDYINKQKIIIFDEFKKFLDYNLKAKNINTVIEELNTDAAYDNSIILKINLNNYNYGEYNLIKNKSTDIIFEVSYKKDVSIKDYKKAFIKKYSQKANIQYPLEENRIKLIAQNLSLDVANFIKNNYLLNLKIKVNNSENTNVLNKEKKTKVNKEKTKNLKTKSKDKTDDLNN